MSSELDPEIRAMALANSARWLPAFEEPTVERARTSYRERYRERSLPPTSDVSVDQLTIPGPGGPIAAKLYRSRRQPVRAAPLIVYFHGGGFVLGDADAYERQSTRFATEAECAVLFPEFRLAPEHAFPAAVDDAIAVVDWIALHAVDFGVDPVRIGIAGDSAGGNLATNVCLSARDRGTPRIAFQCLLYPWIDFRPYCGGPSYASVDAFSQGHLLDRQVMEWFAQSYLRDAADAANPRVSPILAADVSRLPPTAIVTAGCDPLRDMGAAFAQMLAGAGTAVEYISMEGLAHNFMGHTASSSRARHAFDTVVGMLRRQLS